MADERRGELLEIGRAVLHHEGAAVAAVGDALGDDFVAAAEVLLACQGRVVCLGVGKSGIIARKAAASLASLGTPALFVHAAEAVHGDLGMICRGDVVIALSHSGATAEVVAVLPSLRALEVPIVAVTDRLGSPLAEAAQVVLCPGVSEEADHLRLAPTSSTTAALALVDALAVTVARARGFDREDFARTHPGGSLGRALRG